MELGDRIHIQGMTGIVVALISESKFAPDYPADVWAYLKSGALVLTDEAGLVHYLDLDMFDFEQISN